MSGPLTWFLTAPILVAGLVAGHELGYRFTFAEPHERTSELAHTGHGYFEYAPYLAAVGIALAVVGLGLRMLEAIPAQRRAATSFAFALLPPLGFILLEAIERLSAGELSLSTMTASEVVTGLGLQLPFALAALLVARLLGSLADAIAVALRSVAPRPSCLSESTLAPPGIDLAPVRVAELAYGERGPPFS